MTRDGQVISHKRNFGYFRVANSSQAPRWLAHMMEVINLPDFPMYTNIFCDVGTSWAEFHKLLSIMTDGDQLSFCCISDDSHSVFDKLGLAKLEVSIVYIGTPSR
jgi:hypothetical protein